MKSFSSRGLRAGALAAGIAGVLGLATVGTAPADEAEKRGVGDATIKMKDTGGPPIFTGDDVVAPGNTLTIVNRTSQSGPHFFSITKSGAIPTSNKELKDCAKFELKVCRRIAKAHEVNPNTFKVGKRKVDSGATGWDASFGSQADGDSWYTDRKGKTNSRPVTAAAGETLSYFCLIHPGTMRGEIDVAGQ